MAYCCLIRDRKGTDPHINGYGEKLGRAKGKKNIIRTHSMKKTLFSILKIIVTLLENTTQISPWQGQNPNKYENTSRDLNVNQLPTFS